MGRFDDLLPQAKSSVGRFGDLIPGTAKQEAGQIPTRAGLMSLAPTREELPEFLGSLAGGVAKTTGAGMALGGLGAAGGEAFKQLGQRFGMMRGAPPATPSEAALGIAGAGLRGMAGEAGGRAIGGTVKRLFSPFMRTATEQQAALAALKAGKEAGIELPLSAISPTKSVQAAERFGELSMFGSPITRKKERALIQFQNFADKISEEIGEKKPGAIVGQSVKDKIAEFENVFRSTRDELYDAVLPKVRDAKPLLTNVRDTLNDIIKNRSGVGEPEGLGQLRTWAKQIENGQIQTFSELRKFKSNIGARTKFGTPGSTGLESDLRRLFGAAESDLDATAANVAPEMKDALVRADAFFQQGIEKLKSRFVKALSVEAEQNPDNLWRLAIKEKSPQTITTAKEFLGDETFQNLKKQWFDDLLNRSKTQVEGLEIISPAKLSSNLNKFGEALDAIFAGAPQELEQIQRLRTVSQALSRAKNITSGSQTAFLQPLISLQRQLIAGAIVPLTSTGIGQRLLTFGFPRAGAIAGDITARAVQPAAQIGLQRFTRPQNEEIR